MSKPLHISITLMDDPVYKQSSIRVADALARAGYAVTLIGRRLEAGADAPAAGGPAGGRGFESRPVRNFVLPPDDTFRRVRFRTLFKRGKAFYAEMNLRIFFYLLFHRADLVCAVNLDTILPVYAVSVLKRIPRVYDARELFTELAEVVARPRVQKTWLWVERTMVPRFPHGYAVCQSIADELRNRYGVSYAVVRNMTVLRHPIPGAHPLGKPYLLYQGAVNHGRGLDVLIPAMQEVALPLVICGTGNYMEQSRALVRLHGLEHKVLFTGQLPPRELIRYTYHAYAGINLVEREGLNQYFSLPNKLFDYIHAGIPQVTMDYPEYRRVQEVFEVALLIPDVTEAAVLDAIGRLSSDGGLYKRLRSNCREARLVFNWQAEEAGLLERYSRAINNL